MGLLISLIIIALIVTLILGAITWKLSNIILKPKVLSTNEVYDKEVLKGRLDEEFYSNIKKEEFILTSRYGYKLSGMILSNEETKKSANIHKVAVLSHGYTYAKFSSICYAKMLMELGFTCVIYDHRNHGESEKAYTSMGYYEKFDLQTVIDFCYGYFGEDIKIITHGESMGAATVLNHLEIDGRVTCAIADCSFSDLKSLFRYQLKKYYHLPADVFLPFANVIIKIRAGFYIKEVSPINSVCNTMTPILFIHGEDDMYIPASMSIEMYEKRREAKDIFICKGAKHTQSCIVEPIKYRQSIIKFLDKYYV